MWKNLAKHTLKIIQKIQDWLYQIRINFTEQREEFTLGQKLNVKET